jgi:acyl-CoA synthetase (AMP-forming)/AMP-acid ligase II
MAIITPPMAIDIASNPGLLESLSKKLEFMLYGGGDLRKSFGDILASSFKLFTSNGSTETAPFPLIRVDGKWPREDWKYNRPHPAAGVHFKPYTEGLYEGYVVRNPIKEEEQPVFKLYPQLEEFATKDLFSPHPTKPDLWTYRGRTDDMINLASGTINPSRMEHTLTDHPKVREVVMVPVGKYAKGGVASYTGLLIELEERDSVSTEQRENLLGEIWPMVDKANLNYRPEAQVSNDRILFASPQKTLPRNVKGMVQRSRALDLYSAELENL